MPVIADTQHQIESFRPRLSLLRRCVRINTALDLGDSLLMAKDQLHYLHCTRYDNRHNWNQPNTETHDRLHHQQRSCKVKFLVELTGIEPVASWLQTRRSPS
jgi:hypothetical protein